MDSAGLLIVAICRDREAAPNPLRGFYSPKGGGVGSPSAPISTSLPLRGSQIREADLVGSDCESNRTTTMRTLIFLGTVLAAASAAAQAVSQRELEACAAIERAVERLDCFETLTARGAATAPAATESATRASGQSPLPEPESDPVSESGSAPAADPESEAAADFEQAAPAPSSSGAGSQPGSVGERRRRAIAR